MKTHEVEVKRRPGRPKGAYLKPPKGLLTARGMAQTAHVPVSTIRYYLKKLKIEAVIEDGNSFYTQGHALLITEAMALPPAKPGRPKGSTTKLVKQQAVPKRKPGRPKGAIAQVDGKMTISELSVFSGIPAEVMRRAARKLKFNLGRRGVPLLMSKTQASALLAEVGRSSQQAAKVSIIEENRFNTTPNEQHMQETIVSRIHKLENRFEQMETGMINLIAAIGQSTLASTELNKKLTEALPFLIANKQRELQGQETQGALQLAEQAGFTARLRLTEVVKRIVEHNRGWRDTLLDYPEVWGCVWQRVAQVGHFRWNDKLTPDEKQIDAAERWGYLDSAIAVALQYEEELAADRETVRLKSGEKGGDWLHIPKGATT